MEQLAKELNVSKRSAYYDICRINVWLEQSGLLSILDDSRVSIFETADSWRKRIRMAGKPPLDNGSIRKEYLDTLISQIDYYGPYMFLTDRVMLAHAKPESGVNRLDISFSVFRNPAVFTETRRASVVIALAAENQEKRLKILQDILTLIIAIQKIIVIIGSQVHEW